MEIVTNDLGLPPYTLSIISLLCSCAVMALLISLYKLWKTSKSVTTLMWAGFMLALSLGLLFFSLGYFGLNNLIPDFGNDAFTICSQIGSSFYMYGIVLVFSKQLIKKLRPLLILILAYQIIEVLVQAEGLTIGGMISLAYIIIIAVIIIKTYTVTKNKRLLLIPIHNFGLVPAGVLISQPYYSTKLIGFISWTILAGIWYLGLKAMPEKRKQ